MNVHNNVTPFECKFQGCIRVFHDPQSRAQHLKSCAFRNQDYKKGFTKRKQYTKRKKSLNQTPTSSNTSSNKKSDSKKKTPKERYPCTFEDCLKSFTSKAYLRYKCF